MPPVSLRLQNLFFFLFCNRWHPANLSGAVGSLMAVVNSLGVGRGTKSAGELTYRYVRGRTIASRRVFTNLSKTVPQIRQRKDFAAVSVGIKAISQFVDLAYNKTKYGSKRNAAAKHLFDNLSALRNYVSEGLELSADIGEINAGNVLLYLNFNPKVDETPLVLEYLAPGSPDDYSYVNSVEFLTSSDPISTAHPNTFTMAAPASANVSNENPLSITCFYTYSKDGTNFITPYLIKRKVEFINTEDFITYNSDNNEIQIVFSFATFRNVFSIPAGSSNYNAVFVVEFEKKRWKVPYSFYLKSDA